jgi:hypothetical protein
MSGLTFGFGSNKSKNFVDTKSRSAMFGNLDQANSLPGFQGFSQGLLSQFRDPYEDQAVRAAQGDLDYQRQLAVDQTGDAATRAGAFGGSRHGVAEALTNDAFARQGGLLSSQMRSQGHWNSVQAAMQQLLSQNQYGLMRQGTITDALRAIMPNTKGVQSGWNVGWSGGGGGSSGSGGGDMASLVQAAAGGGG